MVVVVVITGLPSKGAFGWLMSYKNSGMIGTRETSTYTIKNDSESMEQNLNIRERSLCDIQTLNNKLNISDNDNLEKPE